MSNEEKKNPSWTNLTDEVKDMVVQEDHEKEETISIKVIEKAADLILLLAEFSKIEANKQKEDVSAARHYGMEEAYRSAAEVLFSVLDRDDNEPQWHMNTYGPACGGSLVWVPSKEWTSS